MAELVGFAEAFAAVLAEVAPVLDERARRLLMGAGARQLGWGGITLIAAATGASADTVGKGAGELEVGIVVNGRVRAKGADPAGQFGQAARARSRRARWLVLVRSSGCLFQYASRRIRLSATAENTCSSRVLGRPR